LATGHLEAEKAAALVKGITDGCKLSAMPLLGGETAEMPGFYQAGEYDMAGFAVGVVDESKIITGADIKSEDVLIGLSSSGIHSNGYSLVRKLFFDKLNLKLEDHIDELGDTLGNVLIEPTKIYVKSILKVLEKVTVKGMVHMTGGGFYENIPRILPKGLGVDVNLGTWPIVPVFNYMMEQGDIDLEEMFATFNMGIGYILVVSKEDEASTLQLLESLGEKGYSIGAVTDQHEGVQLCQG